MLGEPVLGIARPLPRQRRHLLDRRRAEHAHPDARDERARSASRRRPRGRRRHPFRPALQVLERGPVGKLIVGERGELAAHRAAVGGAGERRRPDRRIADPPRARRRSAASPSGSPDRSRQAAAPDRRSTGARRARARGARSRRQCRRARSRPGGPCAGASRRARRAGRSCARSISRRPAGAERPAVPGRCGSSRSRRARAARRGRPAACAA